MSASVGLTAGERGRLEYVEELLRDAWAWAEGDVRQKISNIASEVQDMLSGDWTPPHHIDACARFVDGNVVHLPGSVPAHPGGAA